MLLPKIASALLLVAGAHASIGDLIIEGLTRNSPSVERRYQEIAKANLRARNRIEFRQNAVELDGGPGNNVVFNPDGTVNMTAWDAMADAACEDALNDLPQATNPSGTCVCYNLPLINNQTGAFQADLRLYRLSAPSGVFTGIKPEDVQVSLSYNGASVSPVTQQMEQQRTGTRAVRRQADDGDVKVNSSLQKLQTYLFVGQVDKNRMSNAPLEMPELEALVMPVVTLSAVDAAGESVSTNVSSNEAAFVAGAFSQSVVTSDFNLAMNEVQREVDSLLNGTTAFVLPGVQILVFPVGLVVTSIWLVIGLGFYGLGTFNRITFSEQYKSRTARQMKGSVGRI